MMKKKVFKSLLGLSFAALFAFGLFGGFSIEKNTSSDITLAELNAIAIAEAECHDCGGGGTGTPESQYCLVGYTGVCYVLYNPLQYIYGTRYSY